MKTETKKEIEAAWKFVLFANARDQFAANRCDDAIMAIQIAMKEGTPESVSAMKLAIENLRSAL